MKFQNRSIHGSKVNRRTDRQTDRQTDKPKAICPSNFFKVGGIIKGPSQVCPVCYGPRCPGITISLYTGICLKLC